MESSRRKGPLLLQLLLLVPVTVMIAHSAVSVQIEKMQEWTRYTDAMYKFCISRKDTTVNMKLTALLKCFTAQREYLGCISSGHLARELVERPRNATVFQAPCGAIRMGYGKAASNVRRQWLITAFSHLYLNLTFLELVLPMPYSRCDRFQGSEVLIIGHQNDVLDLILEQSLFLCGEHSPFSLVWPNSRVLLVYKRVPSIPQVGHFRIQYQVCDKRVRIVKVQTIRHASVFHPVESTSLKLSSLPPFQRKPNHLMYSAHLVGSRLRLLDMLFNIQGASKEHLSLKAFDGPGPAELHRLDVEQKVLDSEWIYFFTFQAYLQITCEEDHCRGVFIEYRWLSALPYGHKINLRSTVTTNIDPFIEFCSEGNNLYCIYSISTPVSGLNVEIFLEKVKFHGPDYLEEYGEPDNCLLAGVTVADGYRAELMHAGDSYFADLGDIPRELAVDTVLPEITTCFEVPLTSNGKVVTGFPIDTFVSFGSTLVFVIYAYGAYVDLSKSDVIIVVRPSHSAGLIISCPSIVADGYLTTDIAISVKSFSSHMKESRCNGANILHVYLVSFLSERYDQLASEIIICSGKESEKSKSVLVVPHLSSQVHYGMTRSLFMQFNPYGSEINMGCLMQVMDSQTLPQHLDFDLHVKKPLILGKVEYNAEGRGPTSDTRVFLKERKQHTGRYLNLSILTAYTFINMKLNVSLSCVEPIPVRAPQRTNTFEDQLKQAVPTVYCQNYVIAIGDKKHDNRNNTYIIYLPRPHAVKLMRNILLEQVQMGNLTALMFNWEIRKFFLIAKIRLRGQCLQQSKRTRILLAYRALVSHTIAVLEWELVLNPGGVEITLSDMPMSEIMLSMTIYSNRTEEACSAIIDIRDDAKHNHTLSIQDATSSDQAVFANYHLLWTHREYTWDEAEETCQQLGGMHLASISSENEYLLVSRMLLGSAYHVMGTSSFHLPVLTPCLMGSPLCLIYIGLKTQNKSVSWSDGRPTAYLRWNRIYFRGDGPDDVQYHLQRNASRNSGFQKLLETARSVLQPQYTDGTLCTVLMGSPGPQDMEFISVPCQRKLLVSGIMCIRGGSKLSGEKPLYSVTHVKVKAKDSQLVNNGGNTQFNIDALYEALTSGNSPPENQESSRIPYYYENLSKKTYSKWYNHVSQIIKQPWIEDVHSCNNATSSVNLCDILWPYNTTGTNNIQQLTAKMFITKLNQEKEDSFLSIKVSNTSMFALPSCKPGSIFDGKQCIHILERTPDLKFSTLQNACRAYLNESGAVYVHSVDGDVSTLAFILRRLGIPEKEAISHDELENLVVLCSEDNNLEVCLAEKEGETAKYVVCTTQPKQPTCPPAYVTCNNGCLSDQFVCDGRVDCENGKDEQNCTHLCEPFHNTPHYCLTSCHPHNCTCHGLYFQCPSGGCVHSSKLCNGRADCTGMEDEVFCFDVTFSRSSISTENDFIPDTSDSSDEKIYINLLRSVKDMAVDTCGSVHLVPCVKGHPACYSIDKTCLYDHTEDGRLKYCRNGLHLLECESFQCSASFKCEHSYCVPTHKVCNGVLDCPYGDDEDKCPILTCINMLRCGQTCVHPNEICDGIMHCESGEDELACGAPRCPSTCLCVGYAMKCHGLNLFDGSFGNITILIVRHPNVVLFKEIFSNVTSLILLDISHCNVKTFSSKGPFYKLNALRKLNLSHNKILSLGYGSLDGLTNLMEIDISENPLNYLEPQVFAHMSRLRVLSLHHCQLRSVPDMLLSNSHSLDVLDMTFNGVVELGCLSLKVTVFNLTKTVIRYEKYKSERCWKNVERIISDQTGLCCLGDFKESCVGVLARATERCHSLLLTPIILSYSCTLLVVLIACNVGTLLYKILKRCRDALLICNLALANVSSAVPLYILINWHILHGTGFAFYEPFLSKTMECRISGGIFVVSSQLSTLFQALISLQKYSGIVRGYNIQSEYKVLIYVVIITAWAGAVFVCSILEYSQTSSILEGLFFYFRHKQYLLYSYLVTNIIFVFTAVFSYGNILKTIHESRVKAALGRKHGKDTTLWSIIRVIVVMVLSNILVLGNVCLTAWLFLTTTDTPETVTLVVFIYPLQSAFNPFLFTLSTQQFVRDVRNLFLCNRHLGLKKKKQ